MSEISIHDETNDSVAIRKGRMKIYVFHQVAGELRYNGAVNAGEHQHLDEVPQDVVSKAESHTGLKVTEHTQEHIERLEGQN